MHTFLESFFLLGFAGDSSSSMESSASLSYRTNETRVVDGDRSSYFCYACGKNSFFLHAIIRVRISNDLKSTGEQSDEQGIDAIHTSGDLGGVSSLSTLEDTRRIELTGSLVWISGSSSFSSLTIALALIRLLDDSTIFWERFATFGASISEGTTSFFHFLLLVVFIFFERVSSSCARSAFLFLLEAFGLDLGLSCALLSVFMI